MSQCLLLLWWPAGSVVGSWRHTQWPVANLPLIARDSWGSWSQRCPEIMNFLANWQAVGSVSEAKDGGKCWIRSVCSQAWWPFDDAAQAISFKTNLTPALEKGDGATPKTETFCCQLHPTGPGSALSAAFARLWDGTTAASRSATPSTSGGVGVSTLRISPKYGLTRNLEH